MKIMKHVWRSLGCAVVLAVSAQADGMKFDFKDPKGVNTVTFVLDAPLEAISGSASGISGTVVFDPEKPEATQGKILVATASMHVPNPVMKEHMHAKDWMDATSHPELAFEAESLQRVKRTGDTYEGEVRGKMT
ncbi:MAG: YceI family protein, partial [Limisphaerales bacterium]